MNFSSSLGTDAVTMLITQRALRATSCFRVVDRASTFRGFLNAGQGGSLGSSDPVCRKSEQSIFPVDLKVYRPTSCLKTNSLNTFMTRSVIKVKQEHAQNNVKCWQRHTHLICKLHIICWSAVLLVNLNYNVTFFWVWHTSNLTYNPNKNKCKFVYKNSATMQKSSIAYTI